MEFTDEDNVAFSEWLSRHGGSIHDRYDKVDGEVSCEDLLSLSTRSFLL